jgi:hypothetical protein
MKIFELLSRTEKELEIHIRDILLILKENNVEKIPFSFIFNYLKNIFPNLVDEEDKNDVRELISKQKNFVLGVFNDNVFMKNDTGTRNSSTNLPEIDMSEKEFQKLLKKGLKSKFDI